MKKTLTYNIIRYCIGIICLLFLTYKILSTDHIKLAFTQLYLIPVERYILLILAVVLLPVNIFWESIKWQTALSNIIGITLKESIKSVLWGYTGAFITPNSIGEYPTRSLNLPEGYRTKAVTMGFVGSLTQTLVITLCGIVGLLFWIKEHTLNTHTTIALYCAIIIVSTIGILFLINIKTAAICLQKSRLNFIGKIAQSLNYTTHSQTLKLFIISFLKYVTFSTQFMLVLIFLGIDIPLNRAAVDMSVFYLFLTYTPLINVFEVAVRSSIAIFIFGRYTDNPLYIVIGSTIFWLLNFCIPSLAGLLFVKKKV